MSNKTTLYVTFFVGFLLGFIPWGLAIIHKSAIEFRAGRESVFLDCQATGISLAPPYVLTCAVQQLEPVTPDDNKAKIPLAPRETV